MSKTATEQLRSQNNVEESTTGTSSTRQQVNKQLHKNSSVWVRGNDEDGYYATIGNHRITETAGTIEDIEDYVNFPDVDTIITIFLTMNTLIKDYYDKQHETEETKPMAENSESDIKNS